MSEAYDLSAYRARKEAADAAYREQRDLEQVGSRDELLATIARLQAAAKANPAERHERAKRIEERRTRLRDAGVLPPREGTPQGEAWLRVVRAETAGAAAYPGHEGSAKAMRGIARWLDPRTPEAKLSTYLLSGDPGTGKTVAAWAALAAHGGLFLSAGDVAPTPRWSDLRERAKRVGLLVINDLTERLTGWVWGAIEEVIVDRHDRSRRTLLTSNLSASALVTPERLTSRVESRLEQGAVLVIAGGDLRGRKS